MKVSMKYAFVLAFSLFFFTGCTGTTSVGIGVYGGYGYPYYGYRGGYYRPPYHRPPNRPVRPDRPTTRPIGHKPPRPVRPSRPSMGRPSARPSRPMGRPTGGRRR